MQVDEEPSSWHAREQDWSARTEQALLNVEPDVEEDWD